MKHCDTPKHGRLISSVTRLMKLYISRTLSEQGIPIRDIHLFVLLDILHFQGTSFKESCFRQACDKTTLTKSVKKLVELGYVEVREDEKDKRISRLYTTETAHNILMPCKDVMIGMREHLYKDMSEEEVESLNSLMGKVHSNLLDIL